MLALLDLDPTPGCTVFRSIYDLFPECHTRPGIFVHSGRSLHMEQYIAIIRGINVGGHNKVNMKILRNALETSGLEEVRTYIQSGNIVFRSPKQQVSALETGVQSVLQKTFQVSVPVIVRERKEWKNTLSRNPFISKTDDHTKLLVTFLSNKPSVADAKAVTQHTFPHDAFAVDGKDVYLFCKDGYGKTEIPNTFFEKHLKVTGTTRNWRTVQEIAAMLD